MLGQGFRSVACEEAKRGDATAALAEATEPAIACRFICRLGARLILCGTGDISSLECCFRPPSPGSLGMARTTEQRRNGSEAKNHAHWKERAGWADGSSRGTWRIPGIPRQIRPTRPGWPPTLVTLVPLVPGGQVHNKMYEVHRGSPCQTSHPSDMGIPARNRP